MNTYTTKKEHRKHWVGNGFLVHNLIPGYDNAMGAQSSPFLMFDYNAPLTIPPQHISNPMEQPKKRGVGEHPHKGFETVTIVYSGNVEHKDSSGNGDIINSGDVQWMTAGRGIIHQEYFAPKFNLEGGTSEFAQIWVNLPKEKKEIDPGYQSIQAKNIPQIQLNPQTSLNLIAGEYLGISGPAHTQSPILMGNISFTEESIKEMGISLEIPKNYKGYILVRSGEVEIDGQQVETSTFLETNNITDPIQISSEGSAEILFFAGEPLGDPVHHYGPFVMDSQEGLERAFEEYSSGKFGEI